MFGPEGSVAKFTNDALGPLIVRRGDTLAPRTWADIGVRLRPEFGNGFAAWVAPLEGGASAQSGGATGSATGGGGAAAASQTVFQILPQGAPGLLEYTIEIDGQKLRYRNTAATWEQFVWPNANGVPGARISAVTNDQRVVELVNEPGRNALSKMFELAKRTKVGDNVTELSWSNGGSTVTVQLRVISNPGAPAPPSAGTGGNAPAPVGVSGLRGVQLPPLVVGVDAVAASVPAAPAPATAPVGGRK